MRIQPQGECLQQYFESRERVSLIIGPLGSGKTIVSCNKLVSIACDQKPNSEGIRLTRFLAARNTYTELFSTTIKDWLECNGDLGEFNQGGKTPPTHYMDFKLDDGTKVKSEVMFIAFDRPDQVKKARGTQFTVIWLNEVKELPKAVVDILDLRHGRYPSKKEGVEPTYHGMIGDCNAPDEDHWLYYLAEEQKPEDWEIIKQPGGVVKNQQGEWELNPNAENLSNLPEGYYVKGMQGKSEDWIKVNLANEYGFVASGKPVHPRYVDSVHCLDLDFTPSINRKIVLGFDFGRTPACIFLQETDVGGWICFDEFLANDMSAVTFAPELAKHIQANYAGHEFEGWGDPSGSNKGQGTENVPIKIITAAGIPCRPTATNDPLIRRAAVEKPLTEIAMDGTPRLIILPKAKVTRKGLAGGFCYKRIQVSGDEKYKDDPDKNMYSHPVEALEYGLQGEGEGSNAIKQHKKDKYDDWAEPIN